MKYFLFTLFFFQQSVTILAQSSDTKRDYNWRSGFNTWYPYKFNTLWDFNVKPTRVDSIAKKHPNYGQVGMICNTSGDFLLFSNGCQISNTKDQVIAGTSNMNRGDAHSFFCPPNSLGMFQAQGMILLAHPTDTNSFAFFYLHAALGSNSFFTDQLLMTLLNKDKTNSFNVVFMDSTLIRTRLESSHLTACRHANGRDWWIVAPIAVSNKYYKVLYTPATIQIDTQSIGVVSTDFEDAGGQAVFAPNGRKYVRYNADSDIRIFDFDRCTGHFSNPIHISIADAADSVGFAGCVISSNSRFLYVISTDKIYQLDLTASNIAASKITILTYDGGIDNIGLRYTFAHGQLGADGKIYVSNTGGRDALHIIEAPDSIGLACRAVQRRYKLLESIGYALPYFPNFRLGSLKDSPCDTLKNGTVENYEFHCYPNPVVDDQLTIELTIPQHGVPADIEMELWDLMGRRVFKAKIAPLTSIYQIAVESFASGMYLTTLKVNHQPLLTKKITILH